MGYISEDKEQGSVEDKQEPYNNKTIQQSITKPSKSEYFEFLKQEIAFKNKIIDTLLSKEAMMSEDEIEKKVRTALPHSLQRYTFHTYCF